MPNRDKALRSAGLSALCTRLVAYFQKTDTAGNALMELTKATNQGFEDAENGIAEAAKTAIADSVTFADGETFQQKYDAGELTGPPGADGAQGERGPQGGTGPQGPKGADGAPGADGKSAYEYAREGGYDGDEMRFYADLAAISGLSTALDEINGEVV